MEILLSRNHGQSRGFTLTELVVVIVIVGIMALVAIPRFIGVDSFKSRGFSDEAAGVVRYAQKTAIAWRSTVFVCVTATGVTASSASGCASPITHPATGGNLAATAPSGVSLPTVEFRFDGAGRPRDSGGGLSGTITIPITSAIAGDPARQIVVEAETGYVHK
jgi:MSHA pilin protein MshC